MSFRLQLALSLALVVGGIAQAVDIDPSKLKAIDLVDYRGKTWTLDEFKDNKILVVAFLGTECPLAKLYAERLQTLSAKYSDQGVEVIGVMSNRQDSLEEIASFANRQKLEYVILKDAGNKFADTLHAKRTPEVYLYDNKRELRYAGRIDDQYGISHARDEPRRKDLQMAIDELLAGKEVSQPRTESAGCIIGRTKKVNPSSSVTYGGQVAAILNKHCAQCHRDGEIAPFALTDYEEVAGWADMIAEVVQEKRMPPWHASPKHGKFANQRLMTDEEKQILYDWAEAGAPAGDLSELPAAPKQFTGWQLPKAPDVVIPVSPKPINVRATGAVRYQYFSHDPGFKEDKWLAAAELKPGNREVVHHILAFAVPKGQRRGLNGARGFLVGYVPGARVENAPAGYAKKIPAGSELIFQVHYTPIGTPQIDQSELGLVFADAETITHEIITTSAVQTRLRIRPGDANYTTSAPSPRFPANAQLLSMSPHMHVRGKAFKYVLHPPSGNVETLLDIPDYDFNWQTTYVLDQPRSIKEGSRILCTAVFDNSEDNLNNPDPTDTVGWGDQTWDEMMIGYYHYAVPRSKTTDGKTEPRDQAASLVRNAVRIRTFEKLDRDGDGKLARRDTPRKLLDIFDKLDKNKDEVLTREEVASGD